MYIFTPSSGAGFQWILSIKCNSLGQPKTHRKIISLIGLQPDSGCFSYTEPPLGYISTGDAPQVAEKRGRHKDPMQYPWEELDGLVTTSPHHNVSQGWVPLGLGAKLPELGNLWVP